MTDETQFGVGGTRGKMGDMSDRLFDWDDRKRLLDWWHEGRREAELNDGGERVLSEVDLTYAGLMRVAEQVELATREVFEHEADA